MIQPIIWQITDDIWFIACRYLAQSGYLATADFVFAIQATNPFIYDWSSVPPGTIINVPVSG